jgi:hypothetical protein
MELISFHDAWLAQCSSKLGVGDQTITATIAKSSTQLLVHVQLDD